MFVLLARVVDQLVEAGCNLLDPASRDELVERVIYLLVVEAGAYIQ